MKFDGKVFFEIFPFWALAGHLRWMGIVLAMRLFWMGDLFQVLVAGQFFLTIPIHKFSSVTHFVCKTTYAICIMSSTSKIPFQRPPYTLETMITLL